MTHPMTHPASGPAQPDRSGPHPVNVAHLVFGVVFVGLSLTWLLRATGAVAHDDLGWLLPLTPILAGISGLVAASLARRGRTTVSDASEVYPPPRPDHEEQP